MIQMHIIDTTSQKCPVVFLYPFLALRHRNRKEQKDMLKAMLSQPMAGKTDGEIRETREKAIKVLREKGYEIVNTLFTDKWYSKESMEQRGVVQIPLCFLAKSLDVLMPCGIFLQGMGECQRVSH